MLKARRWSGPLDCQRSHLEAPGLNSIENQHQARAQLDCVFRFPASRGFTGLIFSSCQDRIVTRFGFFDDLIFVDALEGLVR